MNLWAKIKGFFTKKQEPEKPQHRATNVGIVYGKDGSPRISPDWVAHLNPSQRTWVDADLARRGFRLNTRNEAERIN